MPPLAWGIITAAASAGCETAGQAGGVSPVITVMLAAIPALGGVAAAWVASGARRDDHHHHQRRPRGG